MIVLGLDPSLAGFGWCLHDSEKEGTARVIARGKFKTSPKDAFVSRYMQLRENVAGLLTDEVEAVGVESPPFGEQFSEGLYGLFLYVNEALYLKRKDVVFFDPVSLKMLAKVDSKVRKGPMGKSDMVEAAKQDTGIKKWDHNEADAYHLARFAARFWMLEGGMLSREVLTPSESKAFLGEHTFTRGSKAGVTEKKGALYKENARFFKYSER